MVFLWLFYGFPMVFHLPGTLKGPVLGLQLQPGLFGIGRELTQAAGGHHHNHLPEQQQFFGVRSSHVKIGEAQNPAKDLI